MLYSDTGTREECRCVALVPDPDADDGDVDLVVGGLGELVDAGDHLTTAQGTDLNRYAGVVLADLAAGTGRVALALALPALTGEPGLAGFGYAPLQAAVHQLAGLHRGDPGGALELADGATLLGADALAGIAGQA